MSLKDNSVNNVKRGKKEEREGRETSLGYGYNSFTKRQEHELKQQQLHWRTEQTEDVLTPSPLGEL